MIISKLPALKPSVAVKPVQFDRRFTTPVRFSKLAASNLSPTAQQAFIGLFLDPDSVFSGVAESGIASLMITVTPSSTGVEAGIGDVSLPALSSRRSGSISQAIQGAPVGAFRAASRLSASSLLTVNMSMETVRSSITTAYAQYVLPLTHEAARLPTTKEGFYDAVFVRRQDPGSVSSFETVSGPVSDSYLLELVGTSIEDVDSLPEWVFVTITSYDGNGVFIGKSAVRVNTRLMRSEHDITAKRSILPPVITAGNDRKGNVTANVVSQDGVAAKLYTTNIAAGSLLQDTGTTESTFLGMVPGNVSKVSGLVSAHLAQSSENLAIYRAVDSLGRFTGTLLGGELNLTCTQASLSLSRTNDGVLIQLLNVPANTSFVKIYRYSNTIDQEFGEQEGTLVLSQPTTGTPVDVSLTDRLEQSISVVARPVYHTYYAECTDNKGNVTTTRNATILIDPSSGALGFAKPTVTGLINTYSPQSNSFTLTFQLGFDVAQETTTTELVKVLTAQGLIQYYGSDIDPNKLTEMMTAKVTLRNMTTGEEAGLGVYGKDATVNATDLSPGYYSVELITTVRKPETSIDTYSAIGYSTPRPGNSDKKQFQYLPAVSINPAGLLNGALVPSGSARPNLDYQKYTGASAITGYFVDATYIPVDMFAATKPSIVQKQMQAVAVTPVLEKVSWQVDKSTTTGAISHFVVRRKNQIRGIIAGNATTTLFTFHDTPESATENGQYAVTGYLFDGTVMAGSD